MPLNVAVAVEMEEFMRSVSTNLFRLVAADGMSNRMASMASLRALSAAYTPPLFTGLLEFSVGVLSKVNTSCLPAKASVSSSFVGSAFSLPTSPLVMPLFSAAHCALVNPLLFSSYSKAHAVPLNL